jgi:beta-lactamase class A
VSHYSAIFPAHESISSMPVFSPYTDGVPAVTYLAMDYSGRVLASRRADAIVYSASTIKLAVLIAAMRQVDAGRLRLDQPVTVREQFRSRIAGAGAFTFEEDEVDRGMPPSGSTVSLEEALGRMVYASSNSGTNMVLELTGMDAAADALDLCGATSSKLERLISDHAARDAGFTHQTTARDLVRIMEAIATGSVATPQSTEFMLMQLRRQEHPVIGAELPPSTDWGSKSGWVDGIHHDVAFVGSPCEPGSYLLAVCTQGYEQGQAVEVIRSVTAAVHSYNPLAGAQTGDPLAADSSTTRAGG